MSIKLGIIGGGVMGEALLSRLIAKDVFAPGEILVGEPHPERRNFLSQQYGVEATAENPLVAARAEILLLAIKPQVFMAVTQNLLQRDGQDSLSLVISILAGVPLAKLEAAFPGKPVIRAMPNTPATVGEGMTALASGPIVSSEHLAQARQIFAAVGEVVEVPEYLMDAVTGLSGSGPGYVAIVIEALTDGGVAAGLPRPIAAQLALQTVLGTARLIQSSQLHPAELKDRVTSPGGTTITGIAVLEQAGFRSALIEAVRAAADRSRELGG
ncbi:pyrroline-5-carboxylate reductase [Leptolyngbya sp. 'hensonii']|uniref:pyrroline-5-carboxylate reductase n=1 Tax=Leptolyngbya sp. 'hensonii' TaxID=1922337 RepID=UPI00094F7791|nr:pyrroline-5-carboxylate reductase [Leptolyngbya sp. 'hensonii']OLP19672.1 pyrroline-5-carboxylate reductase [Leptolyngbya sp. 'hensonii']